MEERRQVDFPGTDRCFREKNRRKQFAKPGYQKLRLIMNIVNVQRISDGDGDERAA